MGNNCGTHPPPDTRNLCFTSVGSRSPSMPNFCAPSGPLGEPIREQFCQNMSTANEWGDPHITAGLCNMDSCQPGLKVPPGHCGNCVGVAGSGLTCERESFTGDAVQCCFNNLDCVDNPTQYEDKCFSDANHNNTCSDGLNGQPNHRNIISGDCKDTLFQYCTGTLSTDNEDTDWISRWTSPTNNCYDAMMKNVLIEIGVGNRQRRCFTPPTPIKGLCGLNLPANFEIDSDGYYWATNLMSEVMKRYEGQGYTLGSLPGLPGWDPFQEFIYEQVCCPYPGLCQGGLNDVCSSHDTTRISLNTSLLQWCGCHLPDSEYQPYSDKFGIRQECTPICNRADVIPLTTINGDNVKCLSNVCLIDDVSVNIINSTVGNGIEFNQVCGGCEPGTCECVVSDTTVSIINSSVGGTIIPITQNCGSISCNQTNIALTGPTLIPVPCEGQPTNPFAEYDERVTEAQQQASKNSLFWTMFAVGVGLLVGFGLLIWARWNPK